MSSERARRWLPAALLALLIPIAVAQEDFLSSAALHEAGFLKAWQLRLPLAPDQQLIDAFLVDDQLYLATNDGFVFAVHADTGANRWLRQVTSEGYRLRRPCHAGNHVIFATPTTIIAFDRLTGNGTAHQALRFPAGTGPLTDGRRLFLGGLDQRLYAFDMTNFMLSWKVITSAAITCTPVLYEGNLYAASSDGTVYSCTAARKTFRWQKRTFGSVTADLAVSEQGVFVAGADRCLYLLDLLFGQIRWQAKFSASLYEPPVLTAATAYQYSPGDGLVAVNTAQVGVDERLRWKLPRGRALLTIDGPHALVLSQDESVLVAGIDDGEVITVVPAPGMTLSAPSPERSAIYVASSDGRLFSARPLGTPLITQADVRAALAPPETQPTTAPAVSEPAKTTEKAESDPLASGRRGTALGGKSKVSRSFKKGGGTEPPQP